MHLMPFLVGHKRSTAKFIDAVLVSNEVYVKTLVMIVMYIDLVEHYCILR